MAREQKQYYDADGNVVVDFDQNEHYARTDRNAFAGCDYHEGLLYFNHYVFDTSMNELAPVPLGDPDYAQDPWSLLPDARRLLQRRPAQLQ